MTAAGVIPMRKAIKLLCLLLAVGGVGVIVGRSIAPPARPPTRQEAEADELATRKWQRRGGG